MQPPPSPEQNGVRATDTANRFQIITKETWKKDVPTHTIDATALKDGLVYLDAQLDKGIPVMAGVSYGDGTHNEGITEHFVVIFEKEGDVPFSRPCDGEPEHGRAKTDHGRHDDENLTAEGIPGQEGFAVRARYYVTMIRRNEE